MEELKLISDNKLLARKWFDEVWNQQQQDSIHKMFAADGLAHGLADDGGPLKGPPAFVGFHRAFLSAFPDLQINIDDMIAEDDKVAIRWRASGTLKGDGLGVSPTGRSMTITGMSIVRVRE